MAIRCQADPACPFPGPLCQSHRRQQEEPEMFEGWYCPTKQMEDALKGICGVEDRLQAPQMGPKLPVYRPPQEVAA